MKKPYLVLLIILLLPSFLWAQDYYVVKRGDTLWKIARKIYKDPHKWKDIQRANLLKTANHIQVGQRLTIPNAPDGHGAYQKLAFVYFNDFHGALEPTKEKRRDKEGNKYKVEVHGIARMATMVKQVRAAGQHHKIPTYFVNAGDFIQGSLLSNASQGAIEAEIFNRMGLSFYTMGNHEIDFGPDNLLKLIRSIKAPHLTANYKIRNQSVGQAQILKVNGISMGVAGLISAQDFSLDMPKADPAFLKEGHVEDEIEKAKEIVSHFKSQGVDLVVLVTHLGLNTDRKLAKEVDGIDVIIGGDSHTAINGCDEKVEKTCIVQAGAEGQYLGYLEVTLWNGKPSFHAELIPLDETVTPDPEITSYLQVKKSELERQAGRIIATNDCLLEGTKATIRRQETNLGDFVNDILKAHFLADVAIYNSGGIRASLPKGHVTMGDIMGVLPFPTNRTHRLKLTGRELKQVLDYNASQVGKGGFLQVSGVTFTLDPNSGVRRVEIGGMPLDPDGMYTVVTNSYIATGGDGYSMLEAIPEDRREYESNPTPIVIDYINSMFKLVN